MSDESNQKECSVSHASIPGEAEFLAEVARRTPPRVRGTDFAAILRELITWSRSKGAELIPHPPEDQQTVGFRLAARDVVLWRAYPRNEDGAKIVVLPKLFRHLPLGAQQSLLADLSGILPNVKIAGTGLLQVPMHALTRDETLGGFCRLLENARQLALKSAAAT
jgi:hypothetical protein